MWRNIRTYQTSHTYMCVCMHVPIYAGTAQKDGNTHFAQCVCTYVCRAQTQLTHTSENASIHHIRMYICTCIHTHIHKCMWATDSTCGSALSPGCTLSWVMSQLFCELLLVMQRVKLYVPSIRLASFKMGSRFEPSSTVCSHKRRDG